MRNLFLLSLSLTACFAASAAAQERQWSLDASDQDAYLVFGVPESDDVGLSIWCAIQSGKVKIFVPEVSEKLKFRHTAHLRLTAGKISLWLNGTLTPSEMSGIPSIETELPVMSPLFPAMQEADRLKVKVAGEEQIYPLIDADITGLIKLCRKP